MTDYTKQTLHSFYFWKEVLEDMGYVVNDEQLLAELHEGSPNLTF